MFRRRRRRTRKLVSKKVFLGLPKKAKRGISIAARILSRRRRRRYY